MLEKNDIETMILNIIKTRPCSAETISTITECPSNYVLMKLRRMEKWKIIKPITKKEVMIWGVCPEYFLKKSPRR
jgi:hypothetical protein